MQALMLRHAGTLPTGATCVAVEVEPTVLAGIGARQIHRALTAALIANEPGLRANLDSEFLHDFRVALRRTRSLLGQLKHVFPENVVAHFGAEFSWMGRLTGPPRDLDVLVLSLRDQPEDVDAGGFQALLAFLGQMQEREHRSLVEALDSPRYRALLTDWQSFLHRPLAAAADAPAADQPLVDVVSRRAWRLSRRLIDSAETIAARTAAEHVHDVRIIAKKLRYLIDATPTSMIRGPRAHSGSVEKAAARARRFQRRARPRGATDRVRPRPRRGGRGHQRQNGDRPAFATTPRTRRTTARRHHRQDV
jgi:CHAD domain-containing protein